MAQPWWKPVWSVPAAMRAVAGDRGRSRRSSRSTYKVDRRPADGAVRDVRRVRHAGDRRLQRHQAGQARRAPGARRRRQPGADHRHAGQRDHLARRGRHGPGHVRDLLRRDRRAERRLRLHRRHVRLRAAGRLGRRRRHDPQPPRGLVAGVRRRARSRCCCCRRAPPGSRLRAAAADLAGRAGEPGPGRRGRRGDQARGDAGGQGTAAGRVHRRAVPADRARHRRPGAVQPGAAARVGRDAGERRVRRAHRPDQGLPAGPRPAAPRRRAVRRHPRAAVRPGRGPGLRRDSRRPAPGPPSTCASCPAGRASPTRGSRPRRRCTRRGSPWWPSPPPPTR